MLRCRRHPGLLRRTARTAAPLALLLMLVPAGSARADDVGQYDARARGSLMTFSVHMPETGVPITVIGGAFDSTAQANSLPQAFGTAGVFPVPAASSAHLLIPKEMPGLGMPIPEEVRAAFKGIDYTNTPNYCQAAFPPAREGLDESYCGGPAQGDKSLAFTSASANGHVKTTGNLDRPLETKTVAESRAEEATLPAAQATFRQATSQAVTGLNGDRVPQAQAKASAASIEILNGIVKLGDVVSETTVANTGTADGTASRSLFSVGSASILGVPVRIGPDGFTVPDGKGPAGDPHALTDAVNKSANVEGFSIHLFPAPPVSNDNGLLTAESGGIEVSYLVDKPAPARITQRYGYTWASVSALPPTAADGDPGQVVEAAGGSSSATQPAAAAEPPAPSTPAGTEQPAVLTAASATSPGVPETPVDEPSAATPAGSEATGPSGTSVAAGGGAVPGVLTTTVGNQAVLAGSLIAKSRALDAKQLRWLYLSLGALFVGAPVVLRLDRVLGTRRAG